MLDPSRCCESHLCCRSWRSLNKRQRPHAPFSRFLSQQLQDATQSRDSGSDPWIWMCLLTPSSTVLTNTLNCEPSQRGQGFIGFMSLVLSVAPEAQYTFAEGIASNATWPWPPVTDHTHSVNLFCNILVDPVTHLSVNYPITHLKPQLKIKIAQHTHRACVLLCKYRPEYWAMGTHYIIP